MEESSKSDAHAVTIRVNDLYKWFEMVIRVENVARVKIPYHGEELLGPRWIYRGQANSAWEIASSFERLILPKIPKESRSNEDDLRIREDSSILYFRQWAEIPKIESPILKGEWLALMRHYEVPTRLIDFSEVPLMALAFSLEDDTQAGSDFAIWAVLGESLGYVTNESLRKSKPGIDRVEILDTLTVRAQSDDYDREEMNRILSYNQDLGTPRLLRYVPIGMNDRQKRQRGLFLTSTHLSQKFMPLLHKWTNTDAKDLQDTNLEMYIADALTPDGIKDIVANSHIIKYVFDKKLRGKAKTFLRCCNVTDLTRYGGIEKLAAETKELLLEGFYR